MRPLSARLQIPSWPVRKSAVNRYVLTFGVLLLLNVAFASLMYGTVGWHFIRGYNEVGNFIVLPAALIQAALNLLVAAAIVMHSWWRRRTLGRSSAWLRPLATSLLLSALVTALSPSFAPAIGHIAKRTLWIKTPLVEAARYGDADLVAILLRNGADPNARQLALGMTPLHYMAARGEEEAVKLLLERGADPNARANTNLKTPLHWAVEYRATLPTIAMLVEHGADPTLNDWKGKTPIGYTAVIPDPERTQILSVLGRSRILGNP